MSKRFDVVIGNPPYQGVGKQQIYTDFYVDSLTIANAVSMIFPVGWQEPKTRNNLGKMNNKEIKRDKQIVSITNLRDVFENVEGAKHTNIVMWMKDYDNGLNGEQNIIEEDTSSARLLPIKKSDIPKPDFIVALDEKIQEYGDFQPMTTIVSNRKPYGLSTDILKDHEKYKLPAIQDSKVLDSDIRLFTPKGLKYVPEDYPFPKLGESFDSYKVFVPYAWGNWVEKTGLGGAYADISIGHPTDTCIETYLECGNFETKIEAEYMAKYMMSHFFRALLYVNKHSQHSTTAYGAIPQQDFTEEWWDLSISEIDDKLFEKYDVSNGIRDKIYENIQTKDESNIIDYGPNNKED